MKNNILELYSLFDSGLKARITNCHYDTNLLVILIKNIVSEKTTTIDIEDVTIINSAQNVKFYEYSSHNIIKFTIKPIEKLKLGPIHNHIPITKNIQSKLERTSYDDFIKLVTVNEQKPPSVSSPDLPPSVSSPDLPPSVSSPDLPPTGLPPPSLSPPPGLPPPSIANMPKSLEKIQPELSSSEQYMKPYYALNRPMGQLPMGQPPIGELPMEQPPMGQPPMGQPMMNQMGQPMMNQMGQPSMNQMGQPPMNQMGQPPMNQMGQPMMNQMGQPMMNQMGQPMMNQMGQPMMNQMGQPPMNQMRFPNQLMQYYRFNMPISQEYSEDPMLSPFAQMRPQYYRFNTPINQEYSDEATISPMPPMNSYGQYMRPSIGFPIPPPRNFNGQYMYPPMGYPPMGPPMGHPMGPPQMGPPPMRPPPMNMYRQMGGYQLYQFNNPNLLK